MPEHVDADNPDQFICGIGADKVQVTQRGRAQFQAIAESGQEYNFALNNVLYAQGAKADILSWGQMSEEGWTATLNAGGVAGRHYAVDPQGNRHTIVFKNRHYYIALGVLVPNGSISETYTPRATNFDDRERGTSTLDSKVY